MVYDFLPNNRLFRLRPLRIKFFVQISSSELSTLFNLLAYSVAVSIFLNLKSQIAVHYRSNVVLSSYSSKLSLCVIDMIREIAAIIL